MHLQHLAETLDAERQLGFVRPVHEDGLEEHLRRLVDPLRCAELLELHIDASDVFGVSRAEFRDRPVSQIFEGDADDDIGVLLGIVRTLFRDPQALEAVRLVRGFEVEVALGHAEIEGLPEPARAGDEGDLRARSQNLVDEHRLVDEVHVVVPQLPEIADPDRHSLRFLRPLRFLICSLGYQAVPHARILFAEADVGPSPVRFRYLPLWAGALRIMLLRHVRVILALGI